VRESRASVDGESDDSDEVDDAGEPYRDIGAEVALVAIGMSSEVEVGVREDEGGLFELSISVLLFVFHRCFVPGCA